MKQKKIMTTKGEPSKRVGNNGDVYISSSGGGVSLFAKHNNKWYSTPLSILHNRKSLGKSISSDVSNNVTISRNLSIGNNATIGNDLTVENDITMNGDVFQMGSGHNYIYGNTTTDYDITMKTYGQINLIPISQRRVDILTSDASGSGEATLRHSFNGSSHYIFDGADDGDYLKLSVAANGVSTIMTNDNVGEAANLTINPDGDLIFKPEGEQIYYQNDNGNNAALWSLLDGAATTLIFYETGGASTDDYFQIMTIGNGATTISTTDAAGTDGNLSIAPDGSFGVTAATTASLAANNGDITIDASTGIYKFKLDGDADDLCTLTVAANGATTLATADSDGTAGHFTLDVDGSIELNSDHGSVTIKDDSDLHFLFDCGATRFRIYDDDTTSDHFTIQVAANGASTLTTVDNDGTVWHLTLDSGGNITLDARLGHFLYKHNGTEFSAANSAYAGMILAYTVIGESTTHTTYAMTTSLAVPDSDMNVSFVAPPSGNV